MLMKLSEISLPSGDISIKLNQPIEYGKCDYCWYGGPIATVSCNDNIFTVVANGDVVVSLINKQTNEVVAYVKDKLNGGQFYEEMCMFIKNDAHLYEIIEDKDPRYKLDFDNNNWFEIFYNKIEGVITNQSYTSDFTNVFDVIAEAVEKMTEELLPY